MRLVTYERDGLPMPGIALGDAILPLAPFEVKDVKSFLALPAEQQKEIAKLAADAPEPSRLARASVKLLAPILNPDKLLCVGLNYREHAAESKMDPKAVPTVFAKYTSAITGPEADIVLPKASVEPDYEAELGVVIGKRAKNVKADDWEQYVFGYVNFHDVSARDVQLATSQWTLGKSFDTFAPIGPEIVSADEVGDPHALDIQLTVDGEVLQSSNTSLLIFRIPKLIEYLSSILPLEPGDIIATGTPAGVGLGRDPKRWLKPGETVEVKISKLGVLRNRCVAEQ